MFKLFNLKNNYFLGIDFGTSSIKVVELIFRKGGVYLSNYGWVNLPIKNNSNLKKLVQDDQDKEILNLLKGLLRKMDIKADSAHISIGGFRGLSALIDIDDAGNDLEEIIKAEANKYIPVSLDEVYLSWDIVSKSKKKRSFLPKAKKYNQYDFSGKNEKESVEVLLVAAPKDDIRRYEKIVSEVGLRVESLELDIFSVARALIGNDLGTFLIIDMGAKITNLVFSRKGVIRANRNVNVGGNEITKNIMSNLNVSWERAENFKQKNDYLANEGRAMVASVASTIAKEAQRIIELNTNSKKDMDGVIVTGGGSGIVGIEKVFEDILGVKTEIGDSWKRIMITNNKIKEKSSDISGKLAVATGLALKGAENYKRN